ncbi:MAG: LysM peptidoglycan-binding domain-containing protein [Desulfobacteraceae bacterium]|nr:MAG: LysM peptidoglycan-binding domain-containing protein [Desulfobacteraceae bacterium]
MKVIFSNTPGVLYLTAFSLILFGTGCATVTTSSTTPNTITKANTIFQENDRLFNTLITMHEEKAVEYEKMGDLRKALQSLKIVNDFKPNNETVLNQIVYLKSQIQKVASDHYDKGVSYYQNNSMKAALKEFLLALSLNPDHKEALDYVKHRMTGDENIVYEVKKGDTAKGIAQKVYNDSSKDFLIAYFNDLNKETLAPGMTIVLPSLKAIQVAPEITPSYEEPTEYINVKQEIRKARYYFCSKKYQQSACTSEKILEYDPVNKDAIDLKNASYYEMGGMLKNQKKYAEALAVFNNVDPDYKNVRQITGFLNNINKNKGRAVEHYMSGVNYYMNQDLDKAIKEWETTLILDPNHPNAKKDIENARSFLEKLNKIK